MSNDNVIQAFTWTIHLASDDDEWEARCGAPDPEMVAEDTTTHLPGYSICPQCLTAGNEGVR